MMFYPLATLGGFITSKLTFLGFYVPRLVIILIYFALQLVVEIYLGVQTRLNPDVDVFSLGVFRVFAALGTIVFLIWAVYFIYTLQRCVIVIKQHPKAIKGRYRSVILFIAIYTIVFHIIQLLSGIIRFGNRGAIDCVRNFIGATFSVMMGILLLPTDRERMTSTTLEGALHPKVKKGESPSSEVSSVASESVEEKEEKPSYPQEEEENIDLEGGFTGDIGEDRQW